MCFTQENNKKNRTIPPDCEKCSLVYPPDTYLDILLYSLMSTLYIYGFPMYEQHENEIFRLSVSGILLLEALFTIPADPTDNNLTSSEMAVCLDCNWRTPRQEFAVSVSLSVYRKNSFSYFQYIN